MDLVVQSPTTEGRFGFMFKSQPPLPGRRIRCSTAWVRPWRSSLDRRPPASTLRHATRTKRRLQREPQPEAHVGVHLRRPVRRPRHHLRHHAPQRPAVRPLRHHQLPHAPLRPRRHLRAGSQREPPVLRPQRPGQVPDRRASLQPDHRQAQAAGRRGRNKDLGREARRGLRRAPRPANDPDGRPEGTAIIADPRNDQTLIILQLHVAMQKFHNRLVDLCAATERRGRPCSSRLGVWPGGTTSGS